MTRFFLKCRLDKVLSVFCVAAVFSVTAMPAVVCAAESGAALGGIKKLAYEAADKVLENKGNVEKGTLEFLWEKVYDTFVFCTAKIEATHRELVGDVDMEQNVAGALIIYKRLWKAGKELSAAIEKTIEGDYGTAVLSAIAAGAEAFDNPLVKLMCEAAKYTHESYKAVEETGAARDIEALYGALDSDRRLLGTVDGHSDQPPVIPLDDETLNYFYQKYIWEDDTSRELVIQYINKKVGQWPEADWREVYVSYINNAMSADPARRAELEELMAKFRKKVLPWIKMLLKDVNSQARVAWGQARTRQLKSGMVGVMERLSGIESVFPRLEHEAQARKKMANDIPAWESWFRESPSARKDIQDLLKTPKLVGLAQERYQDWESRFLFKAIPGAHLLAEEALEKKLRGEWENWKELRKELDAAIDKQKVKVAENPLTVYETQPQEDLSDEMKIYKDHFEALLKPFDEWKINPKEAASMVLDSLNSGDFQKAEELAGEYRRQESDIDEYHYDNGKLPKSIKEKKEKAIEPFLNRIAELNKEIESYQKSTESIKKEKEALYAQGVGYFDERVTSLNRQIENNDALINDRRAKISSENEKIKLHNKAEEIALEVSATLRDLTKTEFAKAAADNDKMIMAFRNLADKREKQWAEYNGFLSTIESELPIKRVTGRDSRHSNMLDEDLDDAVKTIEDALARIKDNSYVANYPYKEASTVRSLIDQMGTRAGNIKMGVIKASEISEAFEKADSVFRAWEATVKKWQDGETLSADDFLEIQVLSGQFFNTNLEDIKDYAERVNSIERTVNAIPGIALKTRAAAEEFRRSADADERDRQKDAEWIEGKIREIMSFFDAQEKSNVLKNNGSPMDPDYEVVIEEENGMGITDTPYRHYMREEDIKAFASRITAQWEPYAGFAFIKVNAPKVYEKLKAMAVPKNIKPAPEENAIARTGENSVVVLWSSKVAELERAIDAVKSTAGENDFTNQMMAITNIEGMASALTSAASGKKVRYAVNKGYASYSGDYNNPVGGRFVAALEKLEKIFEEREEYLKHAGTISGPQLPGGPPLGPGTGPGTGKGGSGGFPGKPKEFLAVYQLYDARLNTKSLQSAYGDVVLMNTDLRQGMVEITGRLGSMENVDKLLISLDDGRTWKEIPLQENISYQFSPMAGMDYQIVLKGKTKSLEEHKIQFFETVRVIRYENINYTNLVQDVVQSLADAYERQDVSSFGTLIARDFIGNRVFLEEGVRFDFDMFTDIRLRIFIDRIENRGKLYVAETHWEKSQVPRKTGQQQKTTGKTVMSFVLEEGKLRIQNLRGNLIYATLSPEIAEASGLSQTTVEEIRTAHDDRNPTQPGAGETTDSGGTTSSSTVPTQNATITSAPPPGGPNIQGLNFETGTVTTGAGTGDFDFENGNMFVMNGAARIQQVGQSFDALTVAPTSGYAAMSNVAARNVFVFITRGGLYGKLEITSIVNNPPVNDTVTFKYAVQKDGSTNIST